MIAAEPTIFVRNMTALWRWDARLAALLDAVHPADMPAVESAREGGATVRVSSSAGNKVYLHSRYRPAAEAAQWAASVLAAGGGEKYALIISGFGLGHHVRALFDELPDDALIVVGEPNLPLLRAAMESVDLADMLGSGRIMFFTTPSRSELVERLEARSALLVSGTQFAVHQPSVQVEPQFHSEFQKVITEFIAFTRTGFLTLMLNNVATCTNIANNLGRYVTTPPVDLLANACAGRPAVLVAAGPSLARNMHLLLEARTRGAVIIAVQTMLKPLLAAGIEPDFVTSLDYNTVSTRFFENLEEAGATGHVTLVAEPKANWNVLDVFDGTMSLVHNDFAAKLLRDPAFDRMSLKAGATVAHLSFYLAEHLGCDPIVLVGQDLGFVDGLYYKPGTAIHETWGVELGRFCTLETKEWERIARSKAIMRKIPDIHGHPMYTEEQFFVYLQQFERDFAACRARVVDATEGGARKQHVAVMTLQEAIDAMPANRAHPEREHPQRAHPERERRAGASNDTAAWPCNPPPWKTWRCDPAERLTRVSAALQARRQSAEQMQDVCQKTVPLLEEMIEKQSDTAEMDRLFIEVDRMRSRVGADPATFEIVCFLNTIGELRRYQHDLRVKSATANTPERQKRQLLRDIDYVKNLHVGCERLLAIIDGALQRLEKQLAAVREHRPWPREVAGGKA